MENHTIILAIDTSCDETSASIVVNDRIFSNVVSSQIPLHKKWGGVVPIIAKRAHEERIEAVVRESIQRAIVNKIGFLLNRGIMSETDLFSTLDAIAVTVGPGLAPALEVGIRYAQTLAQKFHKPLIPINHMEGHLLSSYAKNTQGNGTNISMQFPLLGVLLSGGHTELILMKDFGSYTYIGQTLDDALGEAFDKVAKLLELGYPGGPIIERLAKEGDENAVPFPIPMKERKDLNFSYSGLKTAVRYYIEKKHKEGDFNRKTICDIAASFQKAATKSVLDKLEQAVVNVKPKGILLGGGVIANIYIRNAIRKSMNKYSIPVYIPYSIKLFTDNAAMIGIAAYYITRQNNIMNTDNIDRKPNLSF